MKSQPIGNSSLVSSRIAFGNMRSVQTWQPAEVTPERMATAVASHLAAYEAGYTHFDSADIYCRGECEKALGAALKQTAGMRDRIMIATKAGIRFAGDPNADSPHRYDFSAEHLLWSCDNSLKNLGIETIDLYYLHRPDVLMNPHEIAKAFDKIAKAGKVKAFAVSNFSPSQVLALQAHLPMKLVANQVEIHPGRLDCFTDGTLDQCLQLGITPLSWSPIGGGWLMRAPEASHPQYEKRRKLIETLDAVAHETSSNRLCVLLAWLLMHPAGIIPIVGSNNPAHIRQAVAADDLTLTRDQWYRVLLAARGNPLP